MWCWRKEEVNNLSAIGMATGVDGAWDAENGREMAGGMASSLLVALIRLWRTVRPFVVPTNDGRYELATPGRLRRYVRAPPLAATPARNRSSHDTTQPTACATGLSMKSYPGALHQGVIHNVALCIFDPGCIDPKSVFKDLQNS